MACRNWDVPEERVRRLTEGDAAWVESSNRRMSEQRAREGLTDWAQTVPWSWFVMQTFRNSYTLAASSRVCYHFLAACAWSSMIRVVLWAAELGPAGNRAHLHMLWSLCPTTLSAFETQPSISEGVSGPPKPGWRRWKEWSWRKMGKATYRPFNQKLGAIPYLTKYIFKRDNLTNQDVADWGIWFGEDDHAGESLGPVHAVVHPPGSDGRRRLFDA